MIQAKIKKQVLLFFICIGIKSFSQDYGLHTKYLVGTFHSKNTTINGASFGVFPNFSDKKRFVRTNGFRFEIPGLGLLGFMANGSMLSEEVTDEIINGINISSGTLSSISYNGVTIAAVVQRGTEINGIAIAGLWNGMNKSKGIQIAGLLNEAKYSYGLQIAISNTSTVVYGLQIGGVNNTEEELHGIQIGGANGTEELYGIQIGGLNLTNKLHGVQIGLFNKAVKGKGLQIGIWNINERRKVPLINWSF